MQQTLNWLGDFVADELPALVFPIAIFLFGWLGALLLARVVRAGLERTGVDERVARAVLGPERAEELDSARWVARAVYWFALVFVAVATLQSLRLTAATEPITRMLNGVFEFLPNLLGASVVLLIAWLVATFVRRVMKTMFARWRLDARLDLGGIARDGAGLADEVTDPVPPAPGPAAEPAPAARGPVGDAVAEAGYWLVLLIFTPAVLDSLNLGGLLEPVQAMVRDVLGFLPRLFSAVLIGAVGWYVARVLQRLTTQLLRGANVDEVAERVGLSRALGGRDLSSVGGILVYALLLIPVAVGALQALELDSITAPASRMLDSFFAAIPALFGAALVVGIGWLAGRLLATLVQNLLASVGFDRLLERLGVASAPLGGLLPSRIVGGGVVVAAMLLATIEAAQLLGFATVAGLAGDVTELAGRAALALVVLGVGLFFASLTDEAVRRAGVRYSRPLAIAARVAIIALASAMALRQLGVADEIIELGFGIVLGTAGVAAALAFGLGGRDVAAALLEDLRKGIARAEERPRAAE